MIGKLAMASVRSGLHRTTRALPANPSGFPEGVLVFVGQRNNDLFVVRPFRNEHNRWFWQDPVHMLSADELAPEGWGASLKVLPAEGFYTLPKTMEFEGGGRWLEGAIVQLGYNPEGQGIVFVAERRSGAKENALFFSATGKRVDDALLGALRWAPILPVESRIPEQSSILH